MANGNGVLKSKHLEGEWLLFAASCNLKVVLDQIKGLPFYSHISQLDAYKKLTGRT